MPNALATQLEALANTLTDAIIVALRAGSLADILGDDAIGQAAEAPSREAARPRQSAPARAARSRSAARPSAPARAPGGSSSAEGIRGRATSQTMESAVALIVKYVGSHPATSGQAARKALGFEKNRWSACAARAVAEGKLRRVGERRSAKYWVK